jgi:hypothetical protein
MCGAGDFADPDPDAGAAVVRGLGKLGKVRAVGRTQNRKRVLI